MAKQNGRRPYEAQVHNQSFHCQYHQERGHTTEDCKMLWSHLEQLVKIRKLKQFSTLAQWVRQPGWVESINKCFFKSPTGYNQHDPCYSRKDWLLSIQGDVHRAAIG